MFRDSIKNIQPSSDDTKHALVIASTPGGLPDDAFRIAKQFSRYYSDGYSALLFGQCKSAGTLWALGATSIIMSELGELGPLDVQMHQRGAMEVESGNDSFQGISEASKRLRSLFMDTLRDVVNSGFLAPNHAAEAAASVVGSVFRGVFEQIDPVKLGAKARANDIGLQYAQQLYRRKNTDGKSAGGDSPPKLRHLVSGYPSHSYVIDRNSAKDLLGDSVKVMGPEFAKFQKMFETFGFGILPETIHGEGTIIKWFSGEWRSGESLIIDGEYGPLFSVPANSSAAPRAD